MTRPTEHGQLLLAAIQAHQTGKREIGERLWRQAHTLWSRAWSANYEALKLFQAAGLTRFAPVKPQRRVIASFDHHCGPHGQPSTLKVIRGGRRENWEDLFNHADQCRSAGLSGSFVLR